MDLVTSVEGSAGGWNFVSANRVPREDPYPAVTLYAIDTRFPGLGRPSVFALVLLRVIGAPRRDGDIIRYG
jgi:hypothetical protein